MKSVSFPIQKETEQNYKKLMAMVRPGDSLLLLMHGSPDPDAIASALTLQEILKKTQGLSRTAFASTEPLIRQQNIEFISFLHLNIQPVRELDLEAYRLIAMMDAQPSFLSADFRHIKPQMVFDHHPYEGTWDATFTDIRPQYGALSSVLTEYLLFSRIRVPRHLHTALLYGIKTDTDNFDRATIFEDIQAYAYHSRRANLQLIRRVELNQTPEHFLKYFDDAYHHTHPFRDMRICFLGEVESADVCVQIADFYLHLIGVYYVVIAGIVGEKLIIIFRGDGYRQNCGKIAQQAFGNIGKGGGHKSAARMEIPLELIHEKLGREISRHSVDNFILNRLIRRTSNIG